MNDAHGPRVFQIGFNRCGTGALYKLFQNSGVPSLHHLGRRHKVKGEFELMDENPQKRIDRNLRRGRMPLDGLEEFRGFFDMEYSDRKQRIENYRYFARFAEAYPDALFIMNTRNKDRWLRSRIAHNNGRFLQKTCERTGLSAEDVLDDWADHYDLHTAEVTAYFANSPQRIVWFRVDQDPIGKLLAFFRPYHELNPKRWKPVHATDWETTSGTYANRLMEAYRDRAVTA